MTLNSSLLYSDQISCGTCQPRQQPPKIEGFDVIIQAVPTSDTTVSVWIETSVFFAGAQFQNECLGMGIDSKIEALQIFVFAYLILGLVFFSLVCACKSMRGCALVFEF